MLEICLNFENNIKKNKLKKITQAASLSSSSQMGEVIQVILT